MNHLEVDNSLVKVESILRALLKPPQGNSCSSVTTKPYFHNNKKMEFSDTFTQSNL